MNIGNHDWALCYALMKKIRSVGGKNNGTRNKIKEPSTENERAVTQREAMTTRNKSEIRVSCEKKSMTA